VFLKSHFEITASLPYASKTGQ